MSYFSSYEHSIESFRLLNLQGTPAVYSKSQTTRKYKDNQEKREQQKREQKKREQKKREQKKRERVGQSEKDI